MLSGQGNERISRIGIFLELLASLMLFIGSIYAYQAYTPQTYRYRYSYWSQIPNKKVFIGIAGAVFIVFCILWRATTRALRLLDEIKTQKSYYISQQKPIQVRAAPVPQPIPPPPTYFTHSVDTSTNIAPSAPGESFDSETEGVITRQPPIYEEVERVQYV